MKNTGVLAYSGKQVFIGIDVHRKFFVSSSICEGVVVKRCRLPGSSQAVISFIMKYFSGAEVITCYEAGYSGFWLHRELEAAGIKNIVVHAASIAVEANNRVKTDKRDSLKMAKQLSAGQLRCIRIPSIEEEQSRLLTRTRDQIVRAKQRSQVQIRMRLHQFNLFPTEIERVMRLKDVEVILKTIKQADLKYSIELLYAQWSFFALQIKALDKELVKRAAIDPREAVYRSVPGIGALIARILSNELGDMSQFQNERALFSYTGLTPGEYSTGGNTHRGHISRQGNSRLRHMLVEAAWKAIRKDQVLKEHFINLSVRTGKKRAIVAVARKLIGRVRAAFKAKELFKVGYKEVRIGSNEVVSKEVECVEVVAPHKEAA